MPNTYKTDTKALRKLMVEKDINTITELSEKTGLSRDTISRVLRGRKQPSAHVMDRLVSVLEICPEKAGTIFFNHDLRNT
jgi:transcriptional regulator with XRE-family HTH domain